MAAERMKNGYFVVSIENTRGLQEAQFVALCTRTPTANSSVILLTKGTYYLQRPEFSPAEVRVCKCLLLRLLLLLSKNIFTLNFSFQLQFLVICVFFKIIQNERILANSVSREIFNIICEAASATPVFHLLSRT